MTTPAEAPQPAPSAPQTCELCGDAPTPPTLYLHARCHITAPLEVAREGDVLILRCYVPECRREVGRFRLLAPADIATIAAARQDLEHAAAVARLWPDEKASARFAAGAATLAHLESRVV